MEIFKHLKKLEEKIESFFEPAARSAPSSQGAPPPPRSWEPLELKSAIVARAEEEIRRIDGRPAFPFNRLDLLLWAPDARSRAILEAELLDRERLLQEVRHALEAARVTPPRDLALHHRFASSEAELTPELISQGFVLECSREQETERMTKEGIPAAKLIVEQGEAEPRELRLEKARINLGRLSEVVDNRQRVVRRNELAFSDSGGLNETVSRVHAHIRFDADSAEFRLFDDNSADGTVIFRDGRRIDVPQGQRRGVPLRDGDEIYLGQARLRFMRDK